MNTSGSAYTNLESLLLFQCLHAYGVGPAVFGRVSDLLKNNPDIVGHKFFQAGRLSPDALRSFYLDRLRRELDLEHAADSDPHGCHGLHGLHHGDAPSSRKRKLPAATLPSVQESLQHSHLLPKLVTKLYASYRNEITEQIRAEEDRYHSLQRDVESIERGEWDDHLRERANGRTNTERSPPMPKKSPRLAQKPLQPSPSPQLVQNGARAGPVAAPAPDAAQLDSPRPLAPQNGQASPSSRKRQLSADQRRAPSTPQPLATPLPPPNSQTLPLGPPPTSQQASSPGYNRVPHLNISPFPPGQQPQAPQNVQPAPSPHPHLVRPLHPLSPAAGSPGPQFQPPTVQSYGGNGVPHYVPPPGAPPHYSPTHQRFPHQLPGPQSPGVQTSHQQQRAPYPQTGQPPYPPLAPQVGLPPPQAGFMLPPFQVSPQDPSRVHQQGVTPVHYPQASTPSNSRHQLKPNVPTPGPGRPGMQPVHPLVIQARHAFSTPVSTRSPLSATGTPMSAKSFWKRQGFSAVPGTPASPRPEVEPLDDLPPLLWPTQSSPKAKTHRKPRAKGKGSDKEHEIEMEAEAAPVLEQEEGLMVEAEPRAGRSRRKAAIMKKSPASITSSRAGGSVRDRSRSHSILSHTETVAADNESQAGNRIKSERGTSADAMEEESVGTPSQMPTRRRGAAARAPATTGRKRTAGEASLEEAEDQFSTPGPHRTITAQRHFSKMCAPIMNDINSHKHASTFTTAVRAKDAEGYYDIIKRPTDLKSIQKAIATGAKQVAAAASDTTPIGSPGGGGAVVELPSTLDYMPPKSIVNAAQLEKELMRMFVNAVMFNPGEDGVVEDAREMFETVQRSVSNWRNVERGSGSGSGSGGGGGGGGGGRTEVEDTPTAEEEEPVQVSKRRKL